MAAQVADVARDMEGSCEVGSPLRRRLSSQLGARAPQGQAGKRTRARGFTTVFGANRFDKEAGAKMRSTLVTGFLYFKQPLDKAMATAVLRERLCAIPRFRSRMVNAAAKGRVVLEFEELSEAELDVAMPVLVTEKTSIKSQADIDSFVSHIYEDDMDVDLPQWRMYLVNNMDDGRSMMMLVVNHAIADGTALVQVLMSVLDDQPSLPVPTRKDPGHGPSSPGCLAQLKGLFAACWGPFIGDNLPGDPLNRLRTKEPTKPGRTKACSMSASLTMEQIKEVRQKLPGATINDVLMTITTLTIQEYFQKYEPKALKQKVRANFPINMRSATGTNIMTEENFGNRFSQGSLRFPLQYTDPMKVFANIKGQIDVIKVSPEPYVRDKVIGCVALKSRLPFTMVADILLNAFGKFTCMLSNVPGPLEEVAFLGQPLDDLSFYALAPIGLYFGIIQYKGNFKVGICCDAEREPEPRKLAECWEPAFQRLRTAAAAAK
mmetsp:Transcript_83559/g.258398  ORF Transcript_83559/g.258398 Transcript_83559/m.258398 type:complete len:490 (-) Transcript_83559:339-1808(-)